MKKPSVNEIAALLGVEAGAVRRQFARNAAELRAMGRVKDADYARKMAGQLPVEWSDERFTPRVCHAIAVYRVALANVGNPDHGEDGSRPLPGTACGHATVQTLEQAAEVCRAYIRALELGSGNWAGGEITRIADGLVIGWVSYNGRVWSAGADNALEEQ